MVAEEKNSSWWLWKADSASISVIFRKHNLRKADFAVNLRLPISAQAKITITRKLHFKTIAPWCPEWGSDAISGKIPIVTSNPRNFGLKIATFNDFDKRSSSF